MLMSTKMIRAMLKTTVVMYVNYVEKIVKINKINNIWFQHDSATCNTARLTMNMLKNESRRSLVGSVLAY